MESILSHVLRSRALTDAALGELVGCRSQHINRIRRGNRRASPTLAISIERALDGEIRRGDLRPDLWPDERAA